MIANVSQGATFGGAISYVMQKTDAETLYQNNVYGENSEEIAAEMQAVSDMRNFARPVLHMSLSLDKDENATDVQWKLAADAYMKKLGFDLDKAQFVVVRHKDAEHDHIHICANLVQLDNSIVKDFQINRRSHEAAREAELASGLKVFVKTDELKDEGKMHDLRTSVDAALNSYKNYDHFKSALSDAGISVLENRSKTTGYLSGISFELKSTGQVWKASELGKTYSLNGLERNGLETGRPQQIQATKAEAKTHQIDAKSHAKPSQKSNGQSHTPSAAATQARVDAERGRNNSYTAQAKGAAAGEEAKRLQLLKQKEHENEDEM